MTFIRQPNVLSNLIIMTFFWSSASFDFFLTTFMLKYLDGNVFSNVYAAITADVLGAVFCGLLMRSQGLKRSFAFSNAVATVGGLLILTIGKRYVSLMPFLIMTIRFGINTSFTLVFNANALLFPTLFSATSQGICNFFARIFTIFASQVAELHEPIPVYVFTLVAAIGIVLSIFIKTK